MDDLPPPPYSAYDPHAPPTQTTPRTVSSPVIAAGPPTTSDRKNPQDFAPQSPLSGDALVPDISGAPYFARRAATTSLSTPKVILTYRIQIKPKSSPENVHFPEPAQKFLERDVNRHDWSTFLNHIFPTHSIERNSDIKNEKSGKLQKTTKQPCVSSSSSSPPSDDSVEKSMQRSIQIRAAIKEWNTGFFLPRGLLIAASIERLTLYKKGPNIDSTDGTGLSALGQAVAKGDITLVQRLLSRGANPDKRSTGQESMVSRAVTEGHTSILALLLEYGADPDLKPTGGPSPIWRAASQSNMEMVQLLLQYGANPDLKPWEAPSAMQAAANSGNFELTSFLLTYNANPNDTQGSSGVSALWTAVSKPDPAIINLLLEYGADPNKKPLGFNSALFAAVESEDIELVQQLLEHGADPNLKPWGGATPLYTATVKGNLELMTMLLNKGASVKMGGPAGTPGSLSMAVDSENIDALRILLAFGADVNDKNWGGPAPLYTASVKGNLEMMSMLLNKGADVKCGGPSASPGPLYMAVQSENVDVVKLLLAHGANVNEKIQWGGESAFSLAMRMDNEEIKELMLAGLDSLAGKDMAGRVPSVPQKS